MLAGELRNHVIVVGYTHLGARIVEHPREAGLPYVLVDRDPAVVDDLVRDGEPVVVDNAKQDSTLVDAGIAHARTVVVATNNVETALLVTKKGAGEKCQSAHHRAVLHGRLRGDSGDAWRQRSHLQLQECV